MKYQVFRNYTVENLFNNLDADVAGYNDISFIDANAERYIWSFFAPITVSYESAEKELATYREMLEIVLNRISQEKVVFVLSSPVFFNSSILIGKPGLSKLIEGYNKYLYEISTKYNHVVYIDTNLFFSEIDSAIIDWRFYFISKMIVNPKLVKEFQSWLSIMIGSYEGKRKKCLILDLDNTLWGGILGEDGIAGIKIGGDYPGNVFQMFQEYLLDLYNKGVMLAVCSKNNEGDVIEAWDKNPNVILKQEHFVAWEINWNNKAENIEKLSQKLNIGLDSFVFIDDNPTERELVKQMLPMVEVPDFPNQPYNIPVLMQTISRYFYTFKITNEDKQKTQQYKDNVKRESLKSSFKSYDDYLRSLSIKVEIQELNEFNRNRIAQLTQKTNQFNFTTKRYTENDIIALSNDGSRIYSISVEDKFGSYGIVGVLIIKIESNIAEIDTFLLSCRILGKEIEFSFINYAIERLKQDNISIIKASYIKTAKNTQVSTLYERMGFKLVKKIDEDKYYEMNTSLFTYKKSDKHKVLLNERED